ncbi:MAG: hypothetical protein QOF63_1746, partial [Thermoanaerobaculia bacterium]|nr:hypothetical protein [Thermoanaerobaculia bacterium]
SILLNLIAYLASCRIILSFDSPEQRRFVVFAIAALSLAPSVVVWSLQPMKDVVFFFLIVAFFGSARKWQQLWSDPARPFPATGALLTWSAAMAVTVYGLSGIRWYFAFMVLLASLVFFLMTIISTRRHFAAAASALLLFVLLLSSFFAGAGSYVPPPIRAAVRNIHDTIVLPQTLVGLLASARRGFDRSGGATLIGAGGAIRKLDRNIGAKEMPVVAAPAPLPASYQQKVEIDKKRTEDAAHPDAPSATASMGAKAPAATSTAPPPGAVPATVALAPPEATGMQQPESEEEGASVSPGTVLMPGSTAGRLIAGTAAIVLPQWVARRIGVLDVRGGRGLWLFAEVDTIFFDIVLAFAIISMIRAARQRTLRAPVFWMIFMVTFTVGASLAYTVSNFGTLFRHRGMFLVGLILLPVAAAGSRRVQPATALEAGSTDVTSL